MATYANDPNETQIEYDLYRVPLNNGKGGTPERIVGASENGMSNNFQCRNGQLMRLDSKLHIVPLGGGKARLMNSWHTFSLNGRWMAFPSKSCSPYRQMYLTHVDADANDTPILVDNSTAANRAANLPEFVNVAPGGMERIEAPANEFYKLFNVAIEAMKKNRFEEAVPQWRQALALNPDDSKGHFNLGYSLFEQGELDHAVEGVAGPANWTQRMLSYTRIWRLMAEAVDHYRKALRLNAGNPMMEADLSVALFASGNSPEALEHLERAVHLDPENAEARSKLGSILAKTGQAKDAVVHLEKAVVLQATKSLPC